MSELYKSIDELVLELEDDGFSSGPEKTIAIIPGAYRPPHLGHVRMVEEYANRVDEVVVLVSSALKGNRVIGENSITAEQSQIVWQELLSDRRLPNVRVEVSSQPTKASAIIEYIGDDGPLKYGTEVILGLGGIDRPPDRYNSLSKHAKRGVSVRPVSESMAQMVSMPSGQPYKSSELRKILDEGGDADEFFGEGMTGPVRSMLGLDSHIEEMSAMGSGAVAGPVARKKKQDEYNELYLYKEVIKLLNKKGIII